MNPILTCHIIKFNIYIICDIASAFVLNFWLMNLILCIIDPKLFEWYCWSIWHWNFELGWADLCMLYLWSFRWCKDYLYSVQLSCEGYKKSTLWFDSHPFLLHFCKLRARILAILSILFLFKASYGYISKVAIFHLNRHYYSYLCSSSNLVATSFENCVFLSNN